MPKIARDVFCLDCDRTVSTTGACPVCGSNAWASLSIGGARILPWIDNRQKELDEELDDTTYTVPFGETEV